MSEIRMSTINTFATEIYWGEPFPGIHLHQYREVISDRFGEPFMTANGVALAEGYYGLTLMNDPFLLFSQQPHLDSTSHMSDEQVDALTGPDKAAFMDQLSADLVIYELFDKELVGRLKDMEHLAKALGNAGYDEEQEGFPGIFVSNYLAKWLEGRTPVHTFRRTDIADRTVPDFTKLPILSYDYGSATYEQRKEVVALLENKLLTRGERAHLTLFVDEGSSATLHQLLEELKTRISVRESLQVNDQQEDSSDAIGA